MVKKAASSTPKQKTNTEQKAAVKTPPKASKSKSPKPKEADKKPSKENSVDTGRINRMIADLEKAEKDRDQIGGELQATVEKLRATFESMNDGIAVTDEIGNLTGVNESFLHMFEYENGEEVLGKNALDFIAENDRERVMMDLARTIEEQSKDTREYKMVTRNGVELDAEISTSALLDSSGTAVGSIAVIRDVSEHRQMQKEIRESEQKLRTLFETITDGIVMIDLDGKIVDTNLAGCTIAGYESKEEVIGRNGMEFADDPEEMANDLMKAVTGETRESSIVLLRKKDGTPFYCEINAAMINDTSGNPIGLVAVERDVTERMQMQEEVRATAEKMRTILESMTDGVAVTDEIGNLIDVNESHCRMYGYGSKDEVIGKNALEFVAESDRDRVMADIIKTLDSGSKDTREYRMVRKNGTELDAEISTSALFDAEGNSVGTIAVMRDITERKRMQEELRKTAEKMRILFDTIGDMFIVTDMKTNILNVNGSAARLLGYSNENQLAGKGILEFIAGKDCTRVIDMMNRTLRTAEGSGTTNLGFKFISHDGREFDVEATVDLLRDCTSMPVGLVITARDVTERKQMLEKIRASEEKLRTILESMTDGVTVTDQIGNLVEVNEAFCRMYGYRRKEEVIGENALDFVAESDRERVMLDIAGTMGNKSKDTREYRMLRKDGIEIDAEISTSALLDASGNSMGTIAVMRDITERKRMQEELRKTAEKMRILFDTVGDIFIVTNMKIDIVSANGAAARLLGYQREQDLVGKSVMEFIVGKDRVRVLDIMYDTLKTKEGSGTVNFESKFVGAKGGEFDAEVTTDLLRDCTSMPVGLVITARDVTERKQMLERVRASEEKLKTIFETINDGIVIVDLEGKIVDVNTAACRFPGYEKEDLIGVDSIQFAAVEDRERMATDIMEAMAKGDASTSSLIYKLNKKDGGTFDCEMSTSVLRDGLGNPTGFVAVERDVTERLKMEKQLKEQTAMLIQSEKKSSLGTLVNGVAHELNNPMTGIIQYAQHCLRHTDKEDRKYEVLQDIEKEARRCANIVWNLVTFARMEAEGEEAYINSSIAELVDRVLMLLNYQIKSNSISITQHYADDLPRINVQQTAIEQVLVNIVNNAMESMKNSAKKEIRFEGCLLDGYLALSITDTGKGIAYDALQRVFDPFYTTKTVGEGTGLGLSVSKSICQQHGGDITCESLPGTGTTFTLKLPVAIA